MPLARVVGVHIGLLDRKESPESFAKRLKTPRSEDLLLAQTKNGEVIAIPGIVEGIDNDKLRFRYQDRTRTMPLKQVEGLIMAARPESSRPDELRPTFTLPGGVVGFRSMERPRYAASGRSRRPGGKPLQSPRRRDPGRAVRRRQDDLSVRPHSRARSRKLRSSAIGSPGAAMSTCWASRCG